MQYIIVYQIDTDGNIELKTFSTGASLRRFIMQKNMHPLDYAVMSGKLLKSFDNKSFDLKNLKGE